ncbi:MAG TPA: FHA domain-containing protein [Planctomycetaceae bacterium]|nr:FHA domain-containing protein [Planctomycetaceae bacterium]
MDVRLLVTRASADAKQIKLGPETLIGRNPECNLRIASGQVSRRHCLVKVVGSGVSVRDLGSANGTRLNGETILAEVDVPILPGSTLVVGPLKFVVQFVPPPTGSDTELLGSVHLGDSTADELQAMAAPRIADGEDTKDYPPSRQRKRPAPPPLVVAGEAFPEEVQSELAPGVQNRPGHGRSTEADFGDPADTVFDVSLEKDARDSIRPESPKTSGSGGSKTELAFEEDDLRQLAAAAEADTEETPFVVDQPAEPGAPDDESATTGSGTSEQPGGWRLLDLLRRKKTTANPAAPPADAASGESDSDDELRKFLKDS